MNRPARSVSLSWVHGGIEYEVDLRVEAYDPGRTYGPPDLCYPSEGGWAEIVAVRDDRGARPDLLAVLLADEETCAELEERAEIEACEAEDDRYLDDTLDEREA